jgi:hypothetical protein
MSMSNANFVAQLLGFIAGINKHYAGATLQLDSQAVTAASLVTLFQTVVDTAAAVTPTEVARTAAIEKATAAMEAAKPMATAFKNMVLTASGKDSATLADFQLTPRRAPVIPPATRVAAAKKAAATRKALGTMGSQQKKAAKKALAAQATTPAEPPVPAPVAAVPPKA